MARFGAAWRGASQLLKKTPNKYGAKKVLHDGHEFDSKREAARYHDLKLQQTAGLIKDLAVHPKYDLVVNGVLIGSYEADFAYKDCAPTCVAPGKVIVEDVKGAKTGVYMLKRRLMLACWGIEVQEVR